MARSGVRQPRTEISGLSQPATQNAAASAAPEGPEIEDDSESGLLPPANPKPSTFSVVGSVAVRTSVSEPVFSFNRVSLPGYLGFCILLTTNREVGPSPGVKYIRKKNP